MDNVSDPQYWSQLYQTNEAGWDKGRCAPPIARMLREGIVPAGASLAVIGCGRGHEAFEAARAGYQVAAIDFAPEAIAAVRARAEDNRLPVEAIEADVFELGARWPKRFDAIVEHTCLCAIDPARRVEYASSVAAALKPGGVLFGLLYAHNRPDGPPYAIRESEVRSLFTELFVIERLVIPEDSFENRAGLEFEIIARKRAG